MGVIPVPANPVGILLHQQTLSASGSRRSRKLHAEPQRLEVAAAFLVEDVLAVLPAAALLVAVAPAADSQGVDDLAVANFCTTHE